MDELPALRASDADRERAVALLREHAAEGRLTFDEFSDRMAAAYAARTVGELDELLRDLPAAPTPRRRPTRFLFSLLGSTERTGRIRVRRRVVCLTNLGNIDLDLRRAALEGREITVVAIGVVGAVDVYLPAALDVDLHGVAIGGHKRMHGAEEPPAPGAPLVRVYVVSIFAGIDVWRVPRAGLEWGFREVIRRLRRS